MFEDYFFSDSLSHSAVGFFNFLIFLHHSERWFSLTIGFETDGFPLVFKTYFLLASDFWWAVHYSWNVFLSWTCGIVAPSWFPVVCGFYFYKLLDWFYVSRWEFIPFLPCLLGNVCNDSLSTFTSAASQCRQIILASLPHRCWHFVFSALHSV